MSISESRRFLPVLLDITRCRKLKPHIYVCSMKSEMFILTETPVCIFWLIVQKNQRELAKMQKCLRPEELVSHMGQMDTQTQHEELEKSYQVVVEDYRRIIERLASQAWSEWDSSEVKEGLYWRPTSPQTVTAALQSHWSWWGAAAEKAPLFLSWRRESKAGETFSWTAWRPVCSMCLITTWCVVSHRVSHVHYPPDKPGSPPAPLHKMFLFYFFNFLCFLKHLLH